jgi:preprotein translocase subunit YajC
MLDKIVNFFVSPASAAATATATTAAPQEGGFSSLFFLGGFIIIFYFMLWRPQSKRAKEHRTLISGLSKGDEVVTSGGVVGKIVKIDDDFVVLAIAEGVEIMVQKPAIVTVLPKGTIKSV